MVNQAELLYQQQSENGLLEVWQNNVHRWLMIDGIEQSRVNTNNPEEPASALDFYFLACLLFIELPKNVLLGGLGGGTMASFLHHKHPEINGLALEINSAVVDIAKKHFYYPGDKWKINITDLRKYDFDTVQQLYDLVIIDIGEDDLTPDWLTSRTMLIQLKRVLNEHGVLIINLLINNASEFSQKLTEIRQVFNCQTLCASIPQHKNIVVYAFNNKPIYHSKEQLQFNIKKVKADWGLDYSTFLDQLLKENPEGSGIF